VTYTIAVSVPEAGLLGAATASRSLAVGAGVLGVRAGVGIVVSQAYTNRSLRRYALDRLELGHSPEEIVATLPEVDPHPELRQVAVLNQAGEFATHTGEVCTGEVATRHTQGAVLVGNLLTTPDVIDAMLRSFEQQPPARTPEELAEQLVRSLHAGERAGGDRRGQQSAAVLVAHDAVTPEGLAVDDIDLRADDHLSPVEELHRLLKIHRQR
jgi:uncharacterized Ntn-hydrolase superfamily protein